MSIQLLCAIHWQVWLIPWLTPPPRWMWTSKALVHGCLWESIVGRVLSASLLLLVGLKPLKQLGLMLALFPQGASVLRGASPGICPQFSALFLCISFALAVCSGQAYFWRFWKHACLKCASVVMGRGQGGKSRGGAMCLHVRKGKHPVFLDKKEMATTLKKTPGVTSQSTSKLKWHLPFNYFYFCS